MLKYLLLYPRINNSENEEIRLKIGCIEGIGRP